MTSGSTKSARSRRTGTNVQDVSSAKKTKRTKTPAPTDPQASALAPIPDTAARDPVAWAEGHIKSLAPQFAKNVEYAAKFGSDAMRYQAAKDGLAMVGITTKPKDTNVAPPPMVFNFSGPVSSAGAPILPFSNAARRSLPPGAEVVTVTETPVTPETADEPDDT